MTVIKSQKSVAINPPKMCQPIGAIWAALGVHSSVPLVNGSQGCSTYPRNLMARHFREPIEVAITSLHEKATIFGGAANIKQALGNIIERQHPKLITLMTTCLSETTGDDIQGIVKTYKAENKLDDSTKIVTVNTPSYVGTHVVGYDNAIKSLVAQLAQDKTQPNGKINIIPGMINPGDIVDIKRMLKEMSVEAIYLTDISQTLNAPLRLPKPHFPPGGTTVEEIADCSNSLGTITMCKHEGQAGAKYLEEKYGVPAFLGALPVGIENTEAFLNTVSKLTGKTVPDTLQDERDVLIDAIVDSNQIIFGSKVAIFGDPDIVTALTRFVYELGMKPMHVLTTLEKTTFPEDIQAIAQQYEANLDELNITIGGDLYDLHQQIKQTPVDLIIGDSKGKYIARDEKIPLVRVGFPQSDRYGYQRKSIVGYKGATQLLDEMVNITLDAQEKR
ncbi:MAG: hypothetical protein NWF04_05470 [Candidatus Bathyarchaeota archaeon]|nr:hypothetical protein [Candidatus Bathyarchaeota archaeon]